MPIMRFSLFSQIHDADDGLDDSAFVKQTRMEQHLADVADHTIATGDDVNVGYQQPSSV